MNQILKIDVTVINHPMARRHPRGRVLVTSSRWRSEKSTTLRSRRRLK